MAAPSAVRIQAATTRQTCAWCGRSLDGSAKSLAGRVRCTGCGVTNTSPWPTDADLDAAYGSWYRPPGGRFIGVGDAVLRRTRSRLAHRLDQIAPPGPVLDVGTGDGALLDALAEQGRDALGLERESTRDDVRTAELRDIRGEWAGVVFWHSLEHLPNPAEAIEHAALLLAPKGVLVVAVPNAESLQARVFGDRWFGLDLPRHLVHLSPRALTTRFRSVGLRVERVSFYRGGQVVFGWLDGMVGTLPRRPSLWDAIRRPEACRRPLSAPARIATLAAAALLAPFALAAALVEIAVRRGGTVYVEARRA